MKLKKRSFFLLDIHAQSKKVQFCVCHLNFLKLALSMSPTWMATNYFASESNIATLCRL